MRQPVVPRCSSQRCGCPPRRLRSRHARGASRRGLPTRYSRATTRTIVAGFGRRRTSAAALERVLGEAENRRLARLDDEPLVGGGVVVDARITAEEESIVVVARDEPVGNPELVEVRLGPAACRRHRVRLAISSARTLPGGDLDDREDPSRASMSSTGPAETSSRNGATRRLRMHAEHRPDARAPRGDCGRGRGTPSDSQSTSTAGSKVIHQNAHRRHEVVHGATCLPSSTPAAVPPASGSTVTAAARPRPTCDSALPGASGSTRPELLDRPGELFDSNTEPRASDNSAGSTSSTHSSTAWNWRRPVPARRRRIPYEYSIIDTRSPRCRYSVPRSRSPPGPWCPSPGGAVDPTATGLVHHVEHQRDLGVPVGQAFARHRDARPAGWLRQSIRRSRSPGAKARMPANSPPSPGRRERCTPTRPAACRHRVVGPEVGGRRIDLDRRDTGVGRRGDQ